MTTEDRMFALKAFNIFLMLTVFSFILIYACVTYDSSLNELCIVLACYETLRTILTHMIIDYKQFACYVSENSTQLSELLQELASDITEYE